MESTCISQINLTQKLKLVLEKVHSIVGKGENAAYQQFLLSIQCFFFKSPLYIKVVKTLESIVKK